MGVRCTELKNGITVVSERMDSAPSTTLGLWFDVGSRCERADQAGLAHFMEHMMFKGTPTRTAADISMHFDRLGASSNAFTGKECTCYYARFVSEKLEPALEVLADMVLHSEFAPDAIETEREVVLEEIVRSADQPDDCVFDLFTEALFVGDTLRRPVLGTKERVASFTHEDCVAFHRQHYVASNLVVAAAGSVDHDLLTDLVERLFAEMPTGERQSKPVVSLRPGTGVVAKAQDIEQAHLVLGFPWMGHGDARRFAGSLMTSILGGSMSSRLFQEVREKRGLVYSIYAMSYAYRGTGMWCVYAGTRPENVEETLGLTLAEIRRLVEEGFDADELERNRDLVCGQLALSQETTASRMNRIGRRQTLGLPHETVEQMLDAYRSVTTEQVRQVAQEFLRAEPLLAVVSPLEASKVERLFAAACA